MLLLQLRQSCCSLSVNNSFIHPLTMFLLRSIISV
jgi:hypothetical protein